MSKVSYVYFLKCNASGKVKIGKAVDIEKRINTIELCNFTGVELIYSIKVDTKMFSGLESMVHRYFVDKRIKREWFNVTKEDIINFVKNNLIDILLPKYIYAFEYMILSGRYQFIEYKRIPDLAKSSIMVKYSDKTASWSLDDSFMKIKPGIKNNTDKWY